PGCAPGRLGRRARHHAPPAGPTCSTSIRCVADSRDQPEELARPARSGRPRPVTEGTPSSALRGLGPLGTLSGAQPLLLGAHPCEPLALLDEPRRRVAPELVDLVGREDLVDSAARQAGDR